MLHDLDRFEFTRLAFTLEWTAGGDLGPLALLRLRRELTRVGRRVLANAERFDRLFDPPVAVDPELRRRFQKPGPPFVIQLPDPRGGPAEAGGQLSLEVTFFGAGIELIPDFLTCLQALGSTGLDRGELPFEVAGVAALDHSGVAGRPANGGRLSSELVVASGRWLLEGRMQAPAWGISFRTPARLLSRGRPLFRADFPSLFPFVLRRVTSVAGVHCGIEIAPDVADPLAMARGARTLANRLAWRDWLQLTGGGRKVDLGGVTGSLVFADPGDEVLDILQLGSLLNLGQGAAYGAGRFSLRPATAAARGGTD